ncbi:MAG: hypothetical protein PHC64_07685, partial [Candidatus Gastranaerophilales bacterium]|nr:hypothetical protein [Candidatus Gastranaerophilales bacterium]
RSLELFAVERAVGKSVVLPFRPPAKIRYLVAGKVLTLLRSHAQKSPWLLALNGISGKSVVLPFSLRSQSAFVKIGLFPHALIKYFMLK